MKPKTKLQKEVCRLREKFVRTRETSRHDLSIAYKRTFEEIGLRNVKYKTPKVWCAECGHSWASKDGKVVRCPHCDRKIRVIESSRRVCHTYGYACVITTFEGWQVLTYHFVKKVSRRGKGAEYHDYGEVIQRWLSTKGDMLTFALPKTLNQNYAEQPWSLVGDMELRNNYRSYYYSVYTHDAYDVDAGVYIRSLLPQIRGVSCNDIEIDTPCSSIKKLLYSPHYYTLLKAGQKQLFHYASFAYMDRFWASMKICIRNGYSPKSGLDWFDLLRALDTCGKDLHNAHYVCPDNLQEAHNYWTHRSYQIERRTEAARYEEQYIKEKQRFFGLNISIGDITLRPLESVEEFKEEGTAMGHCVYTMGYYKKANSLIMTARIKDERVATIEYDLSGGRVLQVRGKQNSATPYDEDIKKGLAGMHSFILNYGKEHLRSGVPA